MTTEAPAKPKTAQVYMRADLRAELKLIAEDQGKKLKRVVDEAAELYIARHTIPA